MDRLSDDMIEHILQRIVSPLHRKACAQVCTQWRRLEGATRTRLRILDPQLLPLFLPRFRNLLSIEAGRGLSNPDLALIARNCTHLQKLSLNFVNSRDLIDLNFSPEYESDAIGDDGISAIAAGCKDLVSISLRWRQGVGNVGITALAQSCPKLMCLDLARCNRLTDQAMEAIAGASSLQVLILKGCTSITDQGLKFLGAGKTAQTLKRLDLCECDQVTDGGMIWLQQFSSLQVLNISECGPSITDMGGMALSTITTLRSLNVSWLINISDVSILHIAEFCTDLRELDVSGCELVTGVGILGFSKHKALRCLTLSSCYNVSSDCVEQTAMECSTLEYLGLDRGLRSWIPARSLEMIENRCTIEWL